MKRPSPTDRIFAALLADLGSDASRRGYTSDWTFFGKWLKRRKIAVLKVTPKDVKAYIVHLADKGQAQRTRGRALSVIRAVYGAFVAEELLKYNPAAEVKNCKRGKTAKAVTWLEEDTLAKMLGFGAPRPDVGTLRATDVGFDDENLIVELSNGEILTIPFDRLPRLQGASTPQRLSCQLVGDGIGLHWPDLDEDLSVKGLLSPSWADRRDRMCIQLLAGTGRRRSEIARMRVEDFTEHGVTGVVKGGAEKTAPVPEWLRRELAAWCAFAGITSGPVLPRSPEDADAINGDGVYAIVKRVAEAVGIDPKKIAPHGLRRTLATLSERHKMPLADIQTQLSHASAQTTETYLKGSRKVAEAPGEWMGEMVRPREMP